MMMRLIALLIMALLCLAAFLALREPEPTITAPVHLADYERCVRVVPGPLKPPKRHRNGMAAISELI